MHGHDPPTFVADFIAPGVLTPIVPAMASRALMPGQVWYPTWAHGVEAMRIASPRYLTKPARVLLPRAKRCRAVA